MDFRPSMLSAETDRALHRQVADLLRREILGGSLPAGERLPAQVDVARGLAVGMKTVNDAYALLRGEGLIIGGRGRPCRVRPLPPMRTVSSSRYRAQAERLRAGQDPVLFTDDFGVPWESYAVDAAYTVEAASERIAGLTGWEQGIPVVVRNLVHRISGEPVQLHLSTVRYDTAQGTILADAAAQPVRGGVFAELHATGKLPDRWAEQRCARICKGSESRILGIGERVPVYESVRTLWHNEKPIEVSILITPTDRVIWHEEGGL